MRWGACWLPQLSRSPAHPPAPPGHHRLGQAAAPRPALRCRAEGEQQGGEGSSGSGGSPPPPAPAPVKKSNDDEGAQTTAIITGAISVIFGVAYLALVYVMDMRGNELLPPPPEAFGPGESS